MAGDGRDLSPREDAAFFRQQARVLREYARSIQQGKYPTENPLEVLASIQERLDRFRPLALVREKAALSAMLAPKIEDHGRIDPDQLYACWQLAHFDRELDVSALNEDAKRITRGNVTPIAERLRSVQDRKRELERLLSESRDTKEKVEVHKKMACVLPRIDAAREELLAFVAPAGWTFDPAEDYEAEWQEACRGHAGHAVAGRLKPDASRIKKERKKRRLTQRSLAKVAKVDIRTIRRAEAGEGVDAQTLDAIATAFDEKMDFRELVVEVPVG